MATRKKSIFDAPKDETSQGINSEESTPATPPVTEAPETPTVTVEPKAKKAAKVKPVKEPKAPKAVKAKPVKEPKAPKVKPVKTPKAAPAPVAVSDTTLGRATAATVRISDALAAYNALPHSHRAALPSTVLDASILLSTVLGRPDIAVLGAVLPTAVQDAMTLLKKLPLPTLKKGKARR